MLQMMAVASDIFLVGLLDYIAICRTSLCIRRAQFAVEEINIGVRFTYPLVW